MFPCGSHEENDNQVILDEFKKLLPTVPVNQRGMALAMYNMMKKFTTCDEASDKLCDGNMEDFSAAELEITGKADGIIEGSRPCSEDELETCKEFLNEDEVMKPEDNDGKIISGYWLTCMKNKKLDITEADEPLLKNLYKLDVIECNDKAEKEKKAEEAVTETAEPKGDQPETEIKAEDPNADNKEDGKKGDKNKTLDVKFYFLSNEWFTNEVLNIQITYSGEEPVKSVSDKVNWKEGKNITQKKVSKKQKSKKTGKTRTIDKVVTTESFFNIFGDFSAEEFEMPEENAETAPEMNLFIVSGTIDEILEMAPYSLEYFLDVHPEEEESDMEDEDDEDDDEEDDESDDDDKKPKKKSGKAAKKTSGKNSKKASGTNLDGKGDAPKEQECKQN